MSIARSASRPVTLWMRIRHLLAMVLLRKLFLISFARLALSFLPLLRTCTLANRHTHVNPILGQRRIDYVALPETWRQATQWSWIETTMDLLSASEDHHLALVRFEGSFPALRRHSTRPPELWTFAPRSQLRALGRPSMTFRPFVASRCPWAQGVSH